MNRFKTTVLGQPKYGFDPTTKTTTCTIKYDITNLVGYINEGPAGTFGINKVTGEKKFTPADNACTYSGKKDNRFLQEFAQATAMAILTKLNTLGIIHIVNGSYLEVVGTAKFNPNDPESEFNKTKGRRIAYAKAEDELLKVVNRILWEMQQLSYRLEDCVLWMLCRMPNSIQDRLDKSAMSIQRCIDAEI